MNFDIASFIESLLESKHVSTHPHVRHSPSAHNRTRTQVHAFHALTNPDYSTVRKNSHSAATRQLDGIKGTFVHELSKICRSYKSGLITRNKLSDATKAVFDKAYLSTYRLGLKASGLNVLTAGNKAHPQGPMADPNDKEWIKSALRHERRYWNDFLEDLIADNFKRFTLNDRIKMYADTLDSVFNTARVVGQPFHSVIYWILDSEADNCPGCRFLRDNSPYTRDTLPTVPKAGACSCIYNCKCSLRIATATPDVWQSIKSSKKRDFLIRRLAQLK